MSADAAGPASDPRELVLSRRLDAPRAAVWRCWTEPDLLIRWFTPKPWRTISAEIDPRPGGAFNTVMRSPEDRDFPNAGVVLEIAPERRLVFTDAYQTGWRPAEKPFFTGIIAFDDDPAGGTAYLARARHWTEADRDRHAEMGFNAGWNAAADQLEELARSL